MTDIDLLDNIAEDASSKKTFPISKKMNEEKLKWLKFIFIRFLSDFWTKDLWFTLI